MPLPRLKQADAAEWNKLLQRRADATDMKHHTEQRVMISDVAFQLGKLIGQGTFGRVYEALNIANGTMLAVKVVNVGKAGEALMKQLEAEIKLLESLRHPNIVNMLGCMMAGPELNILMEFVDGKSIDDVLQSMGALHETIIRKYIKQLLLSLEYCHQRNILHRDIKGKNVLVSSKGVIKLADFGSAKIVQDISEKDNPSSGFSYTPLWVAPEVMSGKYDFKVDIWSLGCVVIEMASAKAPWSECNFQSSFEALYHIGSTNSYPIIPVHLSHEAQEFVRLCLTRNPARRPSATDLLKHAFIVNAEAYTRSIMGDDDDAIVAETQQTGTDDKELTKSTVPPQYGPRMSYASTDVSNGDSCDMTPEQFKQLSSDH